MPEPPGAASAILEPWSAMRVCEAPGPRSRRAVHSGGCRRRAGPVAHHISAGALESERGEGAAVVAFPSRASGRASGGAGGSVQGCTLRAARTFSPISAPRFRRCVAARPSAGRGVNKCCGRVEPRAGWERMGARKRRAGVELLDIKGRRRL